MNNPILLSRTMATMTVSWNQLVSPDTGNSNILSYNLYWDNGLGTINI